MHIWGQIHTAGTYREEADGKEWKTREEGEKI